MSANTYRLDADVATFFEYRRFLGSGGFVSGVEMHPKSGGRLINWPEQHYENGVAKNASTGRSYKGCVRMLKTLRYAMIAEGIASAEAATIREVI